VQFRLLISPGRTVLAANPPVPDGDYFLIDASKARGINKLCRYTWMK
jgi:hypothetical protein